MWGNLIALNVCREAISSLRIMMPSQLIDSYRRLGIGTVWRQAFTGEEWSCQLDHSYVVKLTEALAARDVAAALAALAEHAKFGKSLAREVVSHHGGQV